MPNTTRHKVLPNGAVGPEIARDADEGIDREVSVMVVMNPAVVMQFIKLLQGMLGQVVTQLKAQNVQVEPFMTNLENAAKASE